MVSEAAQLYPSVAVRFEEVAYRIRKRTILEGVTLDIKRGQITGILGPNGAGKTTLLGLVIGLQLPSAGRVTVLGQPVSARNRSLYQKIGVVPQETALYDELTVFENLRFAASLYAVDDSRARIEEILHRLGLSERAGDRVRHLSGGLRRRVLIARALIHAPELLIIDEPTLGVDVDARHLIWSHLRALRSVGTTVVVSTNYLDEALALCDRVTVLRAGRLIASDTPQALVARAGYCLDIECAMAAAEALATSFAGADGVLRTQFTSTGLSVFLQGNILPDPVIRTVLQTTTIQGFRVRGADLSEVFHALEDLP
jgi:ABC-2 type transport system ATP-binding protein